MDHERVRAQERLLKSRNPGEVMTEAENSVAGRKAGLCTRRRLSAGASKVARLERCHTRWLRTGARSQGGSAGGLTRLSRNHARWEGWWGRALLRASGGFLTHRH